MDKNSTAGTLVDLHEQETDTELSDCETEEKGSSSNGGDNKAFVINADLEQERQKLAMEIRQLEVERLQLQREREEFKERAILMAKEVNEKIKNSNKQLLETEKRKEEAELRVRELEQRVREADQTFEEKKEQGNVAEDRLTRTQNATKEMQKNVQKLSKLRTIAESNLIVKERKHQRFQDTDQ
ncbi:hypothetical protein Ocin01_15257 [Orchesella cincta]|uniref:Uncharacterized protein n=1 Tax=Orchesella cincta TaxID=48709 RepID=A0A1D2MEW4_ORCCI|nr:hypothetical protein Ocin01_15257 [Orchesella cincta]